MICQEVYMRVANSVDGLSTKTISVDPGSILAGAVAYSNIDILFPTSTSRSNISPESVEIATSRVDALGAKSHNEAVKEAAKILSSNISAQLSFMDGPVRTIHKDITDMAKSRLRNTTMIRDIGFRIIPTSMPSIYQEETVAKGISNAHTEPRDMVPVMFNLSEYVASVSPEELFEKIYYTGSKELDEDLAIRLNNYGLTAAHDYFRRLYANDAVSNIRVTRKGNTISEFELLFTFVTAYNLSNIDPADVKFNGPRTAYKNALDSILSSIYQAIDTEIRNYRIMTEANYIIGNVDVERKIIYVFKEPYDSYFKQGGTLESIYGYAVGDRQGPASAYSLIDNMQKNTARWEAYKAATVMKDASAAYLYNRNILISVIEEVMRTYADVLVSTRVEFDGGVVPQADYVQHPVYKQLEKEVLAYLNSLNEIGLRDVSDVINHVVFDMLFSFTSASYYLGSMMKIREDFPEMNAEQAKLIATIRYLVSYGVCATRLS